MQSKPTSFSALKIGDRVGRVTNARLWTPLTCFRSGEVEIRDGLVHRVGPTPNGSVSTAAANSQKNNPTGKGEGEVTIASDGLVVDAEEMLAVPGLIDVHLHGAGGGDVLLGTVEDADRTRRMTARGGATGLVIVVPYYRDDQDLKRFRSAVEAIQASRVPGARVLGIHLETPFINPVKRGGFPESCCHPVDVNLFRRLVEATDGLVRVMTLAPELPGTDRLIEAALEANVRVSLGHSDATAKQARRGFALGADRLTHTFNTMNPFHHREIGLLGAALLDHDIFLEVIADGIHLGRDALRFMGTLFPAERLVAITDSNAGAGMPDGYRLRAVGGEAVVQDRAVRLLDGTLAGSTILIDGAVRNLVHMGGMPPRAAIESATLTPARSVGLESHYGSLAPGKAADLAILEPNTLEPLATIVGGKVVWARGENLDS